MYPLISNNFETEIRNLSYWQAVHDAKSEEIGPGIYRFKAELGEPRPFGGFHDFQMHL